MSDLKKVHDQLQGEWSRLQHQWQITSGQWHDAVRYRFEREFWQDFERVIPATITEMQKLDEVIAQARRHVR